MPKWFWGSNDVSVFVYLIRLNTADFCQENKQLLPNSCTSGSASVAPTLRAPALLALRLDQLREESCQVLLVLLQRARGAGSGVEVHDLPGTENLKLHEVEHLSSAGGVSMEKIPSFSSVSKNLQSDVACCIQRERRVRKVRSLTRVAVPAAQCVQVCRVVLHNKVLL